MAGAIEIRRRSRREFREVVSVEDYHHPATSPTTWKLTSQRNFKSVLFDYQRHVVVEKKKCNPILGSVGTGHSWQNQDDLKGDNSSNLRAVPVNPGHIESWLRVKMIANSDLRVSRR
jgi:hypothetical protein